MTSPMSDERWAEIQRVASFGTPLDALPSKSALARMVEDLTAEVRHLRSETTLPNALADGARSLLLSLAANLSAREGLYTDRFDDKACIFGCSGELSFGGVEYTHADDCLYSRLMKAALSLNLSRDLQRQNTRRP